MGFLKRLREGGSGAESRTWMVSARYISTFGVICPYYFKRGTSCSSHGIRRLSCLDNIKDTR